MQNKFQINHSLLSPPLPDFLSLHHLSLDNASGPLISLLSAQCPTINAPHSSQSKPFQTKSNHIIPPFKTLQRLLSTLRIKSKVLREDWSPTDVSFGCLSNHFHQLFPLSYTPAKSFVLAKPSAWDGVPPGRVHVACSPGVNVTSSEWLLWSHI